MRNSASKYKLAYLTADMPVSIDHGIIGLMDPAHGPFVHQAWWWRSRHSIHEKKKNFEPIPNGFRMSAHTPSSNSAPYKLLRLYADADSITTTIDFVLPNLRREIIRAGKYWFSSLTTVTPITRNQCRIDVVAAWNIFRWMPFGPDLLKFVFAKFVEQDRRTMEMQAEGLKHNPHLMLIDDADRPAKWYFQLKAAHLEAKRTGSRDEASHGRPGHAEVEKLEVEKLSVARAPLRQAARAGISPANVEISEYESLRACNYSAHQPLHRFFARLERRQIALREALEVFVEHVRQTLRPHPRRPLHIRTIEHQNFLDPRRHLLVDLRAGEIRQSKNRSGCVPRDIGADQVEQQQHLLGRAVREIDQVDGMALVLDEAHAFFEGSCCSEVIQEATPPRA